MVVVCNKRFVDLGWLNSQSVSAKASALKTYIIGTMKPGSIPGDIKSSVRRKRERSKRAKDRSSTNRPTELLNLPSSNNKFWKLGLSPGTLDSEIIHYLDTRRLRKELLLLLLQEGGRCSLVRRMATPRLKYAQDPGAAILLTTFTSTKIEP